jgi:hypothetical protein
MSVTTHALVHSERGAYDIGEVPPTTPGAIVCGTCGAAWLEDITPAGRCPWEHNHNYPAGDEDTSIDVWLRFAEDDIDHEESEYEGNTFRTPEGNYRAEWYHTAVGLVSSREFPTYSAAREFWESEGFSDYSS